MKSFEEQIEYRIRAAFAAIWVRTHEEERVWQALLKVCQKMGVYLYRWDCNEDLASADGVSTRVEPHAVFTAFASAQYKSPSVLVVFDWRHFAEMPICIRNLKKVVPILKSAGKMIMFVGPTLSLPPELEKDVAVLEFTLPGKEELTAVLDYVLDSAADVLKQPISDEIKRRFVEAALGLTASEAEDLFALAVAYDKNVGEDAIKIVMNGKCDVIKKDGVLEYFDPSETMNDVGGLENLKEWLYKRKDAFSEEARQFGLPNPKGILLVGIPGCGKSLTAKAMSSLWGIPLLRLDMGRVFGKHVGESESMARHVVQIAETVAPCILWIDEIEKGFSGLKSSGETDSGVTARVMSTFLTWMQEKTSPVFIAATGNDVSKLPPELLRKGRFDEIFFVDLPNAGERRQIILIQLRKRNRTMNDDDVERLVDISEGYTGAEIEQAVISALYQAFEDGKRDLKASDIEDALKSFVPLSKTMEQEIAFLRQWGKDRARNASLIATQQPTFLRRVRK